ncbi:hypothetical protein PR048_029081 [Dryococelus australis]|uniref:Uncharacterized protein n=1 Tax=Dryococelus australis TaxID=614101 RepID=A0ABQ9GCD0_9NEOP|nr:hypothetical protein PR048_029081 [Dryococelus australis]
MSARGKPERYVTALPTSVVGVEGGWGGVREGELGVVGKKKSGNFPGGEKKGKVSGGGIMPRGRGGVITCTAENLSSATGGVIDRASRVVLGEAWTRNHCTQMQASTHATGGAWFSFEVNRHGYKHPDDRGEKPWRF